MSAPLTPATLAFVARLLNDAKPTPDAPDVPAEFEPLARELFRRALSGLTLNTAGGDFEEFALAVIQARKELAEESA